MSRTAAGGGAGSISDPRLMSAWVVLVALHSYAVGTFLLFATQWGARFGGFGEVSPLFFARQAGIFHFVIATTYLVDWFAHRSVVVMLMAKAAAVLFLLATWALGVDAWSVPLSAAGDAVMGAVTLVLARAVRARAR